jgi:hypothetical protein
MERLLLTDKSYARDNRLIIPKSSHYRDCLAPRCRFILSWTSRLVQGFDCSSIKKTRELGLERRETVWSLSTERVGESRKSCASMRRLHYHIFLLNMVERQQLIHGKSIVIGLFYKKYCP